MEGEWEGGMGKKSPHLDLGKHSGGHFKTRASLHLEPDQTFGRSIKQGPKPCIIHPQRSTLSAQL